MQLFRLLSSVMVLFVAAHSPAASHDIYSSLRDKSGRSCCDGTDCRPVSFRVTSAGVEMLLNDSWTSIPGEKIEHRTIDGDRGETGGGHWCGERYEGGFITYCAFLPPKVAAAPRSFAQPGASRRVVRNVSMLTAGAPSDADLTGSPAFSP